MRTKSTLHCTKLIVRQRCYIHVWKGGSIIFTTPSQQGYSSDWSFATLSSSEPEKHLPVLLYFAETVLYKTMNRVIITFLLHRSPFQCLILHISAADCAGLLFADKVW